MGHIVWLAPSSTGHSLVPDCGGEIERIAVALTPRVLAPEDPLQAPIGRFIATLSPSCTLVALTERRDGERAQRWVAALAAECGIEIAAVVPDGGFGRMPAAEWIQDRLLCGFVRGEPRYWDADERSPSIAACLGAAVGTPVTSCRIPIEGGNCLVGEGFWLIGCDSIRTTPDAEATVSKIGMLHDAPLHVVGYAAQATTASGLAVRPSGGAAFDSLRQPWFHLDLMISVTGLLRSGRPHLLVADPRAGRTPRSREAEAQGVRLDAMVHRLEEAGFHVSRNPVAFAPGPTTASARPRAYNNVLVENQPRPRVWLPQFGDSEPAMTGHDDANRDLWRDLGFEVVPLYGWCATVGFQGAARCVSKVLARAPMPLARRSGGC